jgi:hypothetical protein
MPELIEPAQGGGMVPITNSLYDPATGQFTGQTGVDWWRQHRGGVAQPQGRGPAIPPSGAPLPPSKPPEYGGGGTPLPPSKPPEYGGAGTPLPPSKPPEYGGAGTPLPPPKPPEYGGARVAGDFKNISGDVSDIGGGKVSGGTPGAFSSEFSKAGLSPIAISGILGNIQQESNFNTRARGDRGTAFGSMQWRGVRERGLIASAHRNGLDPGSPEAQAKFAVEEAHNIRVGNGTLLDAMNAAKSPTEAANLWAKYFERPANIEASRGKYAENFFAKGVAGSGGGGGGGGGKESLSGALKEYEAAVDAPKPPDIPSLQAYTEQWRQQHNQNVLQAAGGAGLFKGLFMAIIGLGIGLGRLSFGASTIMMSGLSGLMGGLAQGNEKRAREGFGDYQRGAQEMTQKYEQVKKARNDALADRNTNIAEKKAALERIAAEHGDKEMADALKKNDLGKTDEIQRKRDADIAKLHGDIGTLKEKVLKETAWKPESAKEKAGAKELGEAHKDYAKAMQELIKVAAKAADDLTKGLSQKARKQVDESVRTAQDKANAAQKRVQELEQRASGAQPQGGEQPAPDAQPAAAQPQPDTQPAAAQPQPAPNGGGAQPQPAPQQFRDKNGIVWTYKGTGDPNSPASYDREGAPAQ